MILREVNRVGEVKKNIPKLRFKGYEDAWEQRKLGEFGISTGGTSIESEFVDDGNYKVISIGSYSETSQYTDQGLRVNKTSKTNSRILNKNDLTMILNDKTSSGKIIGRVLIINEDDSYVYNQRTQRIEVNKDYFSPIFLYQYLNADNIRSKIIRAAQGNTQIYVNWTTISEIEYIVPMNKREQEKIANYYNSLDNLITLHQRKYDSLKSMKKTLLSKMFPKNGEVVPEIRFKGYTDAWEQRKVSEITKFHKQGYYTTEEYNDNKKYYLLRGTDLTGNKLVLKDTPKIDATEKDYDAFKTEIGDFLIVRSGNVGTYGIVDVDIPAIFGSYLIDFRFDTEKVTNEFFGYFYQSERFQSQLNKITQSSANININAENIKSTYISLPVLTEQKKISNIMSALDNCITLHQRKLDELKNMMKTLLQQMFV